MTALNENEKSRCRRHLGYPETNSITVYAMGTILPMQGLFLLESQMDALSANGADRVRQLIDVLDTMEAKMIKAACYLTVDRIGEIQMRPAGGRQGTDLLETEYLRWAKRLSDVLGVPYYYYSEKFGGGINVKVGR
jgi:hypothetical protein